MSSSVNRFHVLILVSVLFSGALFIGPIRSWVSSIAFEAGIVLSPLSFAVPLALWVSAFAIVVRKRVYVGKYCVPYVVIGTVFASGLLVGHIMTPSVSAAYGMVSGLTVVAAIMIYVALSRIERMVALKYITCIFGVYLAGNLLYWWFFLDPIATASTGMPYRRMGGSLAPTVLLGGLIPAFVSMGIWLSLQNQWRGRSLFQVGVGALGAVSALAAGSRLAIALLLLLGLLSVVRLRQASKSVRIVAGLMVAAVALFATVGAFSDYRFLRFGVDSGRQASWTAAVAHLFTTNPRAAILGEGWGTVYPYWDWVRDGSVQWGGRNWFELSGRPSLVSPHNSFLWVAVEGGLLAGIAFILFIGLLLWRSWGSRQQEDGWLLAFSAVSLVSVFFVTDALINAPATGMLCVVMLLLLAESGRGRTRRVGVIS